MIMNKQQVYDFLLTIPKGKVTTYGQIAMHLGNIRFARGIGKILHNNPDPDRYPCYKVVNAKGELSHNYAFGGMPAQESRLKADGIEVTNGRVDLNQYLYRSEIE